MQRLIFARTWLLQCINKSAKLFKPGIENLFCHQPSIGFHSFQYYTYDANLDLKLELTLIKTFFGGANKAE